MEKALILCLLTAGFFLVGCFEAEMCRPVYTPTGRLGFEDLAELPVALRVTDGRSEKIFFRHLWSKYGDSDSERRHQIIKLEKSPRVILEESLETALTRYGYVVREDASVKIDINLKEFLYTCDTTERLFVYADIEFDVTVKNQQVVLTQGSFSKRAEKHFDGFRQLQDAEPVLGECVSRIVEEFVSDRAILNAVRIGYGVEIPD